MKTYANMDIREKIEHVAQQVDHAMQRGDRESLLCEANRLRRLANETATIAVSWDRPTAAEYEARARAQVLRSVRFEEQAWRNQIDEGLRRARRGDEVRGHSDLHEFVDQLDTPRDEGVRTYLTLDCGAETFHSVLAAFRKFTEANGDIWNWEVTGTEVLKD